MLRIGIIGTNFISDRLLDAVKKTDGVIVTAVYSRTEERFTDTEENNMVYELTAFREMTEGKRSASSYLSASLSTMRFLDEVRRKSGIVF